jgi:adenylosuccinate synthase
MNGKLDIVVGVQWGDEGKGKIVHKMAHGDKYSFVARYQGGGNAGHTVYDTDGSKVVLHAVPSGILYEGKNNVIGNGCVVSLEGLAKEIDRLKNGEKDRHGKQMHSGGKFRGNLLLSDRAHVIYPYLHALEEGSGEAARIGTTKQAIGMAYMMKAFRKGLPVWAFGERRNVEYFVNDAIDSTALLLGINAGRFMDKAYKAQMIDGQMRLFEEVAKSTEIVDAPRTINGWLALGRCGIAEGAQGSGLSMDFGTYPFTTSSNTEAGGACTGLGVPPKHIGKTIGVAKAYVTRVGRGPFPTLMYPETEQQIRDKGGEEGATTGRLRRCGWFDGVHARQSAMINGLDELVITKLDILAGREKVYVCEAYRRIDTKIPALIYEFSPDMRELAAPNSSSYVGELTELEGWKPEQLNSRLLPQPVVEYIHFIEKVTGAPVSTISVGPRMEDTIELALR